MKKTIYLICSLILVLLPIVKRAQPFITQVMPTTQCKMSTGNVATAFVLMMPPGATSFSWNVSAPTPSCTPVITPMSPDGSTVSINFQCCGIFTLNCMAFNMMGIPMGNSASSTTITCLSLSLSTLPSNSTICNGSTASFTATGATTYTWLPANIYSANFAATPTANTCYTVVGASGSCTDQAVSCLTVTGANLSVSPAQSQTICSGSTANFTATGASSYSWSNNSTSGTLAISPTVSTNYTLTGTSGVCSSTKIVSVSVNPLPTITVNSSTLMLCKGKSTTLTASGGVSYTWSSSTSTAATIVVTPTVTTTYTATGKSAAGCSSQGMVTQSVTTCTGLNELNNELQVQVYPNPSNGLFTIESPISDLSIELFNSLGQLVEKRLLNAGKCKFDLSAQPDGLYFIYVSGQKWPGSGLQVVKLSEH